VVMVVVVETMILLADNFGRPRTLFVAVRIRKMDKEIARVTQKDEYRRACCCCCVVVNTSNGLLVLSLSLAEQLRRSRQERLRGDQRCSFLSWCPEGNGL
jgi:hypothetical protein